MRNVIDNVRVNNMFLHWTNFHFKCDKIPFLRVTWYTESYIRGHFKWNLWNSPKARFMNFIWNDHSCKILYKCKEQRDAHAESQLENKLISRHNLGVAGDKTKTYIEQMKGIIFNWKCLLFLYQT